MRCPLCPGLHGNAYNGTLAYQCRLHLICFRSLVLCLPCSVAVSLWKVLAMKTQHRVDRR